MIYLFILVMGFLAGCLSGIVGTGSSIVLLPILVFQFGPQQAVPIMAIATLFVNIAKITSWRHEVDWRAFLAFSLPAVPAAVLGARTLLILPPNYAETALGVFFLVLIPWRRWVHGRDVRIPIWGLAIAGALVGFITGVVLSTGPLSVAVFASFGLLKGALLATEAMSALAMTVGKVAAFRQFGALPLESIAIGLLIGASTMAGAFAGKAVVTRMSAHHFQIVIDLLLLVSGLSMLWAALA
jgi:uncharacterized membrane protein YfcA